jgi:hypothetical protein
MFLSFHLPTIPEPVEIDVNHGRRVQRQQLADDEAADDGDAERPAQLGALAEADRQRHRRQQRAMVVIMIGRKRIRQASKIACRA